MRLKLYIFFFQYLVLIYSHSKFNRLANETFQIHSGITYDR